MVAAVNVEYDPYYKESYRILKKTGTLKQAIFKSDEPYSKLYEKYGILLDSITFMPVIETDKGGTSQMISDYQQHLKPAAVELVFSKDTASVFKNNSLIKKAGSKVWVNSLWPDLCGGHNDDMPFSTSSQRKPGVAHCPRHRHHPDRPAERAHRKLKKKKTAQIRSVKYFYLRKKNHLINAP